ncbi:MAG: cache domain-containing protein [Planctomycetota bacterium]
MKTMGLSLKMKLIGSFLVVIITMGIIATAIGVGIIGNGIIREAQNKVTLDLNSAEQIFGQRLQAIRQALMLTSMGVLRTCPYDAGSIPFTDFLHEVMGKAELDFLSLTNEAGVVRYRAGNPLAAGDGMAGDEMVAPVLAARQPVAGTQVLGRDDLRREAPGMAERARISIVPTPRAKPSDRTLNEDGLVLKAAIPVFGEQGAFRGVLYGGILLNRNYAIVDTIKEIVYRDMRHEGIDIGSSTIFQGDLRVATNVKLADGTRAIGTRVAADVSATVLDRGQRWTERAFVVNGWYLTAYSPLRSVKGDVIGILYVGLLEKKYTDMKKEGMLDLLAVTVAGAIAALGISMFLAGTIVKPVISLRRGVEAIERGDFDCDVEVATTDEIGALAASFNHVKDELKKTYQKLQGRVEAADESLKAAYLQLKEKQQQLVQAERLASMGQLSAGVAHELNNPLGTILLHSHILLKRYRDDAEAARDLKLIADESNRCKNIVRGLLDFGQQSRVARIPTDVGGLVTAVIGVMKSGPAAAGIRFRTEIAAGLPEATVDRDQIRQVLIIILENAVKAVDPAAGEIVCSVTRREATGRFVITVRDNGCGIPEANLSKLFTPFFTTRELGQGTGLGLAIAYGIIKMHGGSITVDSRPGAGAVFTVELPPSAPAGGPHGETRIE